MFSLCGFATVAAYFLTCLVTSQNSTLIFIAKYMKRNRDGSLVQKEEHTRKWCWHIDRTTQKGFTLLLFIIKFSKNEYWMSVSIWSVLPSRPKVYMGVTEFAGGRR
jgi:hypothetical protein